MLQVPVSQDARGHVCVRVAVQKEDGVDKGIRSIQGDSTFLT